MPRLPRSRSPVRGRSDYFRFLCHHMHEGGESWHTRLLDAIRYFGLDGVQPDLDFVLAKSTHGEHYFREESPIYKAALLFLCADVGVLREHWPQRLERGSRQRTRQMEAYLEAVRSRCV